MLDDMIVSDNEAFAHIHDDAQSGGTYFALGRDIRNIEEFSEERIVEKRVLLLGNAPLDGDVDDAGRNFLHQRRESGDALRRAIRHNLRRSELRQRQNDREHRNQKTHLIAPQSKPLPCVYIKASIRIVSGGITTRMARTAVVTVALAQILKRL